MRYLPLLLLLAPALAADLPSVDTPVKTGASAKGDAAVVIGIEDYAYLPDATYAARDADAMYAFLVYTRGIPSSRVRLLKGGVSRMQIEEAVATAGGLVGPGGTAWVYFAGHGSASPSSRERLLLPANTLASEDGYDESGVPVKALQGMAAAGGGEALLITDACFTGAGRDGSALVSGGRSWVPARATASGPPSPPTAARRARTGSPPPPSPPRPPRQTTARPPSRAAHPGRSR